MPFTWFTRRWRFFTSSLTWMRAMPRPMSSFGRASNGRQALREEPQHRHRPQRRPGRQPAGHAARRRWQREAAAGDLITGGISFDTLDPKAPTVTKVRRFTLFDSEEAAMARGVEIHDSPPTDPSKPFRLYDDYDAAQAGLRVKLKMNDVSGIDPGRTFQWNHPTRHRRGGRFLAECCQWHHPARRRRRGLVLAECCQWQPGDVQRRAGRPGQVDRHGQGLQQRHCRPGDGSAGRGHAAGRHRRSEDVLFSPQRISLGGNSSVRGFKDQTLTGDSGGYWRNQLRWRRAVDIGSRSTPTIGGSGQIRTADLTLIRGAL